MKILVVSLLRLGDTLLHREIAVSIRRRYPKAKIHFLINDQFSNVTGLIDEVDQWKLLPRTKIEKILVEQVQSVESAKSFLAETIRNLNLEKYDLVINATNNYLSVRLMEFIETPEQRGMSMKNGRAISYGARWLSYFNDHFAVQNGSRFHYVETLQRALNLPATNRHAVRKDTKSNQVYLQIFTSDSKKNWGLGRFKQLMDKIQVEFPNFIVKAICAPSERNEALKVFETKNLISPNLNEAKRILSSARLLISGDTSLQHLAAQVGCQVVGIFIGSADPIKTAPWQEDLWLVQPTVACYPCAHSSKCNQKSHLCAEDISVGNVYETVLKALNFEPHLTNEMKISLDTWVWSEYLDEQDQNQLPRFRSGAIELDEDLCGNQDLVNSWRAQQSALNEFVNQFSLLVEKCYAAAVVSNKGAKSILDCCQSIQELVKNFEVQVPELKDYLMKIKWAIEDHVEAQFRTLKNLRSAQIEITRLSFMRNEILKEMGIINVSRSESKKSAGTVEERPVET